MLTMATYPAGLEDGMTTRMRHAAARLWRTDAPLTAFALLMLPALAAAVVGLLADPRVITGAPAWLKPAKFAVSTAIYAATLAWLFSHLADWPRTRRAVGWTTTLVLSLEIVIIYAQAWRGTSSHFNVATPLDAALFGVMGTAIVVQTLASIAVAVALWRQVFADRALGWAIRLGFTLTIVGAAIGGLMTRPTDAQLRELQETSRPRVVGAHTVGAPDGGSGVPVTGWSREHGDLRVPHFVGLHAIQVLPLLAVLLSRRRWSEFARVGLVQVGAGAYASLFAILLWQALRGQSLFSADGPAHAMLVIWALFSAAAALVAARAAVRRAQALV
jgi:hypothetical protein